MPSHTIFQMVFNALVMSSHKSDWVECVYFRKSVVFQFSIAINALMDRVFYLNFLVGFFFSLLFFFFGSVYNGLSCFGIACQHKSNDLLTNTRTHAKAESESITHSMPVGYKRILNHSDKWNCAFIDYFRCVWCYFELTSSPMCVSFFFFRRSSFALLQ